MGRDQDICGAVGAIWEWSEGLLRKGGPGFGDGVQVKPAEHRVKNKETPLVFVLEHRETFLLRAGLSDRGGDTHLSLLVPVRPLVNHLRTVYVAEFEKFEYRVGTLRGSPCGCRKDNHQGRYEGQNASGRNASHLGPAKSLTDIMRYIA